MTTPPRGLRAKLAAIVLVPALALGLSVASAGSASAHTALRSSDPADGASLPTPPEQISLVFTEAVLDIGAAVQVTGPEGRLDLEAPQVDGATLVQSLPAGLPAGDYTAVWRVTSDDGHPVDGTLAFSATAGAAASSPAASPPAPGATVTAAPAVPNPADQAEDGGVPAWVWIGGLVVLALLGSVGGLVARRRGTRELPAPPIR